MERYTKIRNIGKGNMGQVMLVRCNEDSKLYIMKLIDLSKMNKKERTASLNEAKVLSSLNHLNVIKYVDSFLSRKTEHLCIVMEFAEGGDLSNKVKQARGKHFSEEQILDWFIQTCLAVEYCHQKRVLHRDIKSQNIFLTDEGVIKVGDFGISRVLQNTCDCAHTFVGTPYYLSPELVQERPYNNMSDCWALGVVLYELMALRHPFNATDMKGLMYKILRVIYDPPPLMYSTELRAVVSKLLQKEPSKRPKVSQILEFPIIKRRLAKLVAGTPDANMPAAYLDQLSQGLAAHVLPHPAGERDDYSASDEEDVRRILAPEAARRPCYPTKADFPQIPKPPLMERDAQLGALKPPRPLVPPRQEAGKMPCKLPPLLPPISKATPVAPAPPSVLHDIPGMHEDPGNYRSAAPLGLQYGGGLAPAQPAVMTRMSANSHFYEARRQAEINRLRNAQHRIGAIPVAPPASHSRAWRF